MAQTSSLASRIFSESVVTICIAIGVLLMWIATLVGTFGEGISAVKAMMALRNTGVALVGAMLVCGGAANPKIDRIVRVAMVVMGTMILLVLVSDAVTTPRMF